jgi:hypothetical protein
MRPIPAPPPPGLTSFAVDKAVSRLFIEAAYFSVVGDRAIRIDILERVGRELSKASRGANAADEVTLRISSLLGCGKDESTKIAGALGWKITQAGGQDDQRLIWSRKGPKPHKARKGNRRKSTSVRPDSPFASLAGLIIRD